jgi:hypothetical protein
MNTWKCYLCTETIGLDVEEFPSIVCLSCSRACHTECWIKKFGLLPTQNLKEDPFAFCHVCYEEPQSFCSECNKIVSNSRFLHCESCEYDYHVDCIDEKPPGDDEDYYCKWCISSKNNIKSPDMEFNGFKDESKGIIFLNAKNLRNAGEWMSQQLDVVVNASDENAMYFSNKLLKLAEELVKDLRQIEHKVMKDYM